jgi:hypothetical protein
MKYLSISLKKISTKLHQSYHNLNCRDDKICSEYNFGSQFLHSFTFYFNFKKNFILKLSYQ